MKLNMLFPSRFASQLLILLAVALLVSFLASSFLAFLGQKLRDEGIRDVLASERVEELTGWFESTATKERVEFARQASTRTTRVSIDNNPSIIETNSDDRSIKLANSIKLGSGYQNVRASVLPRVGNEEFNDPRNSGRNREIIAASVQLKNGTWLNFTSREPLTWFTRSDLQFLVISLVTSLFSITIVVWFVTRKLTKPIENLAGAADMAARGDRFIRLSELGPSEVQRASRAFNAMQDEISKFDAERTRTIAAVGHDLRTPITSLRIRTELIENEELRQEMVRTLEQMQGMAEGLMSYANIGLEEAFSEPVDLSELLEKLCDEQDVPFVAHSRPKLPVGVISMSRVVRNLIENAKRYASNVSVSLKQTGKQVLIEVKDDGPGIEEEHMDTIMNPLVRGDDSRNAETGGVGLGLTIARDIVLAHGGELKLENQKQGGLCANVILNIQK